MQIRERQGVFMTFAVLVILVPGIGLYAVLRAVGLGIGAAGIIGLFTMFVALIVFSAWAFRGCAVADPASRSDDEPAEPLSLKRTMAQYSLLRFGIFAGVYAVAAVILVPTLGSPPAGSDAALAAVVFSIPISYRLGRPMRENVTEVFDQRRSASKERDAEDAARVEAARRNRNAEQA